MTAGDDRARACLLGMAAALLCGALFGAGSVLLIGFGWVR